MDYPELMRVLRNSCVRLRCSDNRPPFRDCCGTAPVCPLQMKRTTIAKDFEAKQANPDGDRTLCNEPPLASNLGGTTAASGADWSGNGIAADQFASKDELGELRQAVAMKVSETGKYHIFVSFSVATRVHYSCGVECQHVWSCGAPLACRSIL